MDNTRETQSTRPLVKDERKLFGVIFIGGMALCSFGISQAPTYGWTHPISLLGYGFGGAAMVLGVLVWRRIRIRPISSDRAALIALLGIMAIKILLARLYPFL